jgi:hypothetical protein
MKRDMNLIRAVLIEAEELPDDDAMHDIFVEGFSDTEISNHVRLCDEAGFLDAEDLTMMDGVCCWKPKRLTYEGHEFLDGIRSDTVWEKAKALTLKSTGTLTIEGLKFALPHVLKALIRA